jgi:signal transduction histidine kinase
MGAWLQNGERTDGLMIKQLRYNFVAKIVAYFLLVISVCLTVGCVIGAYIFIADEYYTKSEVQVKKESFYHMAYSDSHSVLFNILRGDEQYAIDYCKHTNFSYEVLDANGELLWNTATEAPTELSVEFNFEKDNFIDSSTPQTESYTVKAYINDEFPETDKYSTINQVIDLAYSLRYSIFIIGILSFVLAVACFIFLLCSAGYKTGHTEIVAGTLVKLPFDLLTAALILGGFFVGFLTLDNMIFNDYTQAVILTIALILATIVGTAYCMNFAVRVKLGSWYKNTVIYRLLVLLMRVCRGVCSAASQLIQNLPLIWKTAVFLVAISCVELLTFALFYWDPSWLLLLWILETLVTIPAVLYLALLLLKLQKGSETLAKGDLSYQVDTSRMFWDFKLHGENLNRIAEGMTRAVDERMKSERFKTELITNVSHDIKTPITSIINYTNLIAQEKTENKKITEYSEVLLRQSERLKRLIQDLVEASMASTGNIDVLLAPCELGVLLTQTVGEYEQRLREGELELITKQPKLPIKIMADGRLLWRVFDNLMNNICKYAQPGTRVYLTIEVQNSEAVISFKNTSRYALDIPADELMERFVRSDRSRSTEGNGLGLSIAQSLMELQKAKLELVVDGDLFKVTLKFNTI